MFDESQFGGRIGLLGLKHPDGWRDWLIELGIQLNPPVDVRCGYESFRPWHAARDYLSIVHIEEHFFGTAYSGIAEKTE